MKWDPLPQDREWYREVGTGQLGWRVQRDGKDMIRLDRADEEICRILNLQNWTPQTEHRPINMATVGRIAFEADRCLCKYIGLPLNVQKEWTGLSDDQRVAWMDPAKGPSSPQRKALFKAVHESQGPFAK